MATGTFTPGRGKKKSPFIKKIRVNPSLFPGDLTLMQGDIFFSHPPGPPESEWGGHQVHSIPLQGPMLVCSGPGEVGVQETRVATREESGVIGFPSRRGLTPRGSLECNPEIPAFPGEEY